MKRDLSGKLDPARGCLAMMTLVLAAIARARMKWRPFSSRTWMRNLLSGPRHALYARYMLVMWFLAARLNDGHMPG